MENNINENVPREKYEGVYRDTMYFIDAIVGDYDFYGDIIKMIREGSTAIEVKRRQIKKTVDESWIAAIEDALPALDEAVRNPGRFLKETEKVQPIEMSRNIGNRSLRHLAQHTDYISKVEGDQITPSKILNIYRDETTQTYENKFVNTLIHHLYDFIDRRYRQMFGASQNENTTKLEIISDFDTGKAKGKFTFGIELSEAAEAKNEENNEKEEVSAQTLSLNERVNKLHSVALMYINSEFCRDLGNAMVRPPIVRTNAILKNKNLRQCLALWEFIQTYQKIGYKIDVEETAEAPDETYIRELYSMLALQYVLFKYNLSNSLDIKTLAENETTEPIEPEFVRSFREYSADEFNVSTTGGSAANTIYVKNGMRPRSKETDREIEQAIDVAFAADKHIREQKAAEERERKRLAELEEKAKREAEEARKRAIERAERLKAAELARKAQRKAAAEAQKRKTKAKKQKQNNK